MNAFDYLNDKLFLLAERFPNVTIRYGFDTDIDRHIVELTPENEYNNNPELDTNWINISLSFMEEFPMETISFISSDSMLRVLKPAIVFNAKEETADAVF